MPNEHEDYGVKWLTCAKCGITAPDVKVLASPQAIAQAGIEAATAASAAAGAVAAVTVTHPIPGVPECYDSTRCRRVKVKMALGGPPMAVGGPMVRFELDAAELLDLERAVAAWKKKLEAEAKADAEREAAERKAVDAEHQWMEGK